MNIPRIKAVLFVVLLMPCLYLLGGLMFDYLGANPVETVTHETGDMALRLLLMTLTVTPLRRLTGRSEILHFRRLLGLYAFFYALLHFSTWLVFDHFFDLAEMIEDIVERPYITIGFSAFVLLLPLAATSTNAMLRRLGGRRWRRLHRLIYLIATLAVLHYLWLVKADIREPVIYGIILVMLLLMRIPALSKRYTKRLPL